MNVNNIHKGRKSMNAVVLFLLVFSPIAVLIPRAPGHTGVIALGDLWPVLLLLALVEFPWRDWSLKEEQKCAMMEVGVMLCAGAFYALICMPTNPIFFYLKVVFGLAGLSMATLNLCVRVKEWIES